MKQQKVVHGSVRDKQDLYLHDLLYFSHNLFKSLFTRENKCSFSGNSRFIFLGSFSRLLNAGIFWNAPTEVVALGGYEYH